MENRGGPGNSARIVFCLDHINSGAGVKECRISIDFCAVPTTKGPVGLSVASSRLTYITFCACISQVR